MASDRYGIYSASFTHAGGTLDLQQVRDQSLNAGSRHHLLRPGGSLNPGAQILAQADPIKRFRTADLLTVLGVSNILTNGLACSGGSTMRFQLRTPGGAFANTSSSTEVSTKGFLHVASIEADIDSETGAEAELEYFALSTDGTNPITSANGVDFTSAPAPAYMSQYYVGGCYLGSSQIEGLRRILVIPGIQFTARRCDGGVFPRYGASSITARSPMIELTFLNAGLPYALSGSFFTNALASTLKVYLQRATAAADGRVAVGTTSHARFDAAAGNFTFDSISVSDEDDALVTVRILITGTLAVTLAVAIP